MSVISNIHTATVYQSKGADKTVAYAGQRLVVTVAKGSRDPVTNQLIYGEHLQQTMATSIPVLTKADIDFAAVVVHEACIEYFQTVQNQIVASRIKSGSKTITSQELAQAAIINYLDSDEGQSTKWSPEAIAQWFTENIAENLITRLMSIGLTDVDVDKKVSVASKRFSDAMSTKAKPVGQLKDELNKIIGFASDKQNPQFVKWFNKINPPVKVMDLEDSLGF
jgi:hypothetical protein